MATLEDGLNKVYFSGVNDIRGRSPLENRG